MQEILLYFFKMIICTGLLFLYYFLFLRDKQIHQYNRFFLLCSVLIGLIFPLISISVSWPGESLQSPFYFQTAEIINVGIPINSNENALLPAYLIGFYTLLAAVFLMRLILSVRRISKLRRKYRAQVLEGIFVYNTEEKSAPFSFMNHIFWNSLIDLKSEKGQQILRHELFHVKQMHSLDLIFMQVIISMAWVNPFLYLIKKELCTVHEYLADQYAVSGNDQYKYAELLVQNAIKQKRHNQLIHSFFHSQLKRRIAMIAKNSNNTGFSLIRKIMSFPLIVILFCSFALKTEIPLQDTKSVNIRMGVSDTLTEPEFQGGAKGWQAFLIKTLLYPVEAQDKQKQGTPVVTFMVNTDGTVSDATLLTDPGYGLGEEALRVIKLSSGKWNPATKNGKAVRAQKSQPFVFRLSM